MCARCVPGVCPAKGRCPDERRTRQYIYLTVHTRNRKDSRVPVDSILVLFCIQDAQQVHIRGETISCHTYINHYSSYIPLTLWPASLETARRHRWQTKVRVEAVSLGVAGWLYCSVERRTQDPNTRCSNLIRSTRTIC